MPMPAIQRCFIEWHDANADRFAVPVRRGEGTPRSLRLDFPTLGLEEHISAALLDSEVTVYASAEGEVWDLLVSLDLVVPERVAGGTWVCRHCVGGVPYTGIAPERYASRGDLWRDHLFEEFLAWVNGTLAHADTLASHRFGEGGTSACLLPVDAGRAGGAPPAYSFPLRRVAAP
jgi:hypothetical protein